MKNYEIFFKILTFLLFLFSVLLFKLFSFPSIVVSIFLMAVYILIKSLDVKVNHFTEKIIILVLLYDCLLLVVSLVDLVFQEMGVLSYRNLLPEYLSLKQFFGGFIYNNFLFIFLLIHYFFVKDIRSYYFLEKTIYYFSGLNVVVSIIEIFIIPLHEFLSVKAGYNDVNFSFIIRPVSIGLNVYFNSFFSAFFAFWSIYYWINEKRNFYLILYLLGLAGTLIAGSRFAIILLIISSIVYLIIERRKLYLVYIILAFLLILLIITYLNEDYLELLLSIITHKDKAGSANLHKEIFLDTLEIFYSYPLGIGIGKADFGALNMSPSLYYNSESFILSLLLQGGVFSFVVYITINGFLIYKLNKIKAYHLMSFSIGVLISSFFNIQILQSITTTFVIAFIYLPALYGGYYAKS